MADSINKVTNANKYCSATALATCLALYYNDTSIVPLDFLDSFKAGGNSLSVWGTSADNVLVGSSTAGANYDQDIKDSLKNGRPVIVTVERENDTHFVTVVGVRGGVTLEDATFNDFVMIDPGTNQGLQISTMDKTSIGSAYPPYNSRIIAPYFIDPVTKTLITDANGNTIKTTDIADFDDYMEREYGESYDEFVANGGYEVDTAASDSGTDNDDDLVDDFVITADKATITVGDKYTASLSDDGLSVTFDKTADGGGKFSTTHSDTAFDLNIGATDTDFDTDVKVTKSSVVLNTGKDSYGSTSCTVLPGEFILQTSTKSSDSTPDKSSSLMMMSSSMYLSGDSIDISGIPMIKLPSTELLTTSKDLVGAINELFSAAPEGGDASLSPTFTSLMAADDFWCSLKSLAKSYNQSLTLTGAQLDPPPQLSYTQFRLYIAVYLNAGVTANGFIVTLPYNVYGGDKSVSLIQSGTVDFYCSSFPDRLAPGPFIFDASVTVKFPSGTTYRTIFVTAQQNNFTVKPLNSTDTTVGPYQNIYVLPPQNPYYGRYNMRVATVYQFNLSSSNGYYNTPFDLINYANGGGPEPRSDILIDSNMFKLPNFEEARAVASSSYHFMISPVEIAYAMKCYFGSA